MTDQLLVGQDVQKIFDAYRDEIWKRQVSNSENFDKSILTYSSAGLALSLTFLKDFAPSHKADSLWLLYLSWGSFVIAILLTVVSWLISQRGLTKQLELAEKYYLEGDKTAFGIVNRPTLLVELIAVITGTIFILAVIFTTAFAFCNVNGSTNMSETKPPLANDGAPVPSLQPMNKGMPIPAMQKVPVSQPTTPATQPSKSNESK